MTTWRTYPPRLSLEKGLSREDDLMLNANLSFEKQGGIQAHILCLDFSHSDVVHPTNWILKAQLFFSFLSNTTKTTNCILPLSTWRESHLSWHNWLIEYNFGTNWDDFLISLRTRFGPLAYEDPVESFTKLRHTGRVEAYRTNFEILSYKITGISEEFRIRVVLLFPLNLPT